MSILDIFKKTRKKEPKRTLNANVNVLNSQPMRIERHYSAVVKVSDNWIGGINRRAVDISKSNYRDYDSLDIVAFSYAVPGAMGEDGGIYIISADGNIYHTNIAYSDMTMEDAFFICPPLKDCHIGLFNAEPPNGWSYFYMGAGNFLFVIDRLSELFKEKNFYWSEISLYNQWIVMVLSLLKGNLLFETIREFAISRWKLGPVHGISHWDRVYRNGLLLLKCGVNPVVVGLFAYLHDSCRENDSEDIKHGPRAAEFIETIRKTYLADISEEEIELLKEACRLHTTTLKTGNPTIDACFDADRLDIWRVGIVPDPDRLATERGKAIASNTEYSDMIGRL